MTSIAAPVAEPSLMRRIFDNRLMRFFSLFVITLMSLAAAQIFFFTTMPKVPVANRETFGMAITAVSAVFLLFVYWLCVRLMEHRKVREISLRAVPGALAGAAIGGGLFVIVIAVLWQMGIAHVVSTPGESLLAAANMALLSGIGEELVFRGVVYRIFEEMFGTLAALLVSAALFGAIHLGNRGATLTSGVAIALEAGLLLAACYALTRSLWLAMGLHFGWNFTEGGIFGGDVSGQKIQGVLHTTFTGPDMLTGGKFGAEGSLVAIAVCTSAALVILILAIRRGQWKAPRFAINDRNPSLAAA